MHGSPEGIQQGSDQGLCGRGAGGGGWEQVGYGVSCPSGIWGTLVPVCTATCMARGPQHEAMRSSAIQTRPNSTLPLLLHHRNGPLPSTCTCSPPLACTPSS